MLKKGKYKSTVLTGDDNGGESAMKPDWCTDMCTYRRTSGHNRINKMYISENSTQPESLVSLLRAHLLSHVNKFQNILM